MSDNDKSDDKDLHPITKQPKYRGGRVAGQKNRFSPSSVRKLAQLGFDPIEHMVKLYDEVDQDIAALKRKPRFSDVALAGLLSVKQKITADLMRYGYARVPETLQLENKELPKVTINLTTAETFSTIENGKVIEDEPYFVDDDEDYEDDDEELVDRIDPSIIRINK
jgi:hypothetical protein